MNDCQHLIFLHLPKNGGTTIYQILNRIYKQEQIFTVHWQGEQGNITNFYQYTEPEKEEIKLLRGHFDYGIHDQFKGNSEYFTFLRNSEERMRSFYSYVKRRPENRLFQQVNETNMNFTDFILLGDKDGNNGQIRKLSGLDSDEITMLNAARAHIETHFPVVGLQEYFDESILVLAHHYKWPLPIYIKQNVSKKKNTINPEESKLINDYNQGDMELYRFAEERLKHQIKSIPFFRFKLFMLRFINMLISNPIAIRVFKTRKLMRIVN